MQELLYTVLSDFRHTESPPLTARLSEDLSFDATDRVLFAMAMEAESGVSLSAPDADRAVAAVTLGDVLSLFLHAKKPPFATAPCPPSLHIL